MRSVVLAFTPAGGWLNAKVMPPLIARAREQKMSKDDDHRGGAAEHDG
jgi:hypothetical protein